MDFVLAKLNISVCTSVHIKRAEIMIRDYMQHLLRESGSFLLGPVKNDRHFRRQTHVDIHGSIVLIF